MILRKEVVLDRLDYLRELVLRLDELRTVDRDEFLRSYRLQWLVERGLQLAAQTVIDTGAHILVGHFNARANDSTDMIRLLGLHGVISAELQKRLERLPGFRNVLVHGYLGIDQELVYSFLQRDSLAFREFADAVDHWLAARA